MRGLLFWLLCSPGLLTAQDEPADISEKKAVYVFKIREEIAPPVQRTTIKALQAAREKNADLILIEMNTYGGMLESADTIRTALINSPIPVWVFIDNNAASAGALISIACDSIYMSEGASIGAATVVNQTGEELPDKYQSYMRSMMRATAEAKGRDPEIAQAMVDERVRIEGIIDSGQVLTFTTSEAILHGFCEGKANSIEGVLEAGGIREYEIIRHRLTTTDRIIGFLISPIISGLLIMIIIGGLYFEMQTPGLGFPSAASVLAALLYFAPLYLEGLAEHWEILLFIAGIILLAVEIFALPGFGVPGILGAVLILSGLTLSMVDNVGFELSTFRLDGLLVAFFTVISAAFLSIISSFWLGRKVLTTPQLFGNLALNTTQKVSEGYVSAVSEYTGMIGKEGIAYSILRPSGKVELEGDIYDATAETGYIEAGSRVKVVRYATSQLIVRKISPEAAVESETNKASAP
jgi:membrane-bound serine protease (ClpP class)